MLMILTQKQILINQRSRRNRKISLPLCMLLNLIGGLLREIERNSDNNIWVMCIYWSV